MVKVTPVDEFDQHVSGFYKASKNLILSELDKPLIDSFVALSERVNGNLVKE